MFADACFCINLASRPDRWERFCSTLPSGWPFPPPQRWPAVDGKAVERPKWWTQPPGAWGCLCSHREIWRWSIENDVGSVLVLEDDAVWCRNFVERVTEFVAHVPGDWDQVYLGGQHWGGTLPRAIDDCVLRCRNVNRTHAYVARLPFMRAACEMLRAEDNRHVDYRLGSMHESGRWNVYGPRRWLVGQAPGESDIGIVRGNKPRTLKSAKFWNDFQVEVVDEPAGTSRIETVCEGSVD